jgi:hypothetical protein
LTGFSIELKTLTLRQAEDFDWTSIWEQEWHEEHARFYTFKTGFCRGSIGYTYDDGVKPENVSPAANSIFGATAAIASCHTMRMGCAAGGKALRPMHVGARPLDRDADAQPSFARANPISLAPRNRPL